jgi:hypothetical protein
MSPQQTRSFVNGVLDIPTVQAADPSMLSLFDDRSPFAGTGTLPGTRLTVRGVSTGVYGSLYYMQEDGSGAAVGPLRSGISIFGPSAPLTPGRKYRVVGQVQEFGNETEIVQTVEVTDEGVAGAQQVPVFASGRTNDINALEPPLLGDIGVLADTTTDMTGDLLTGEDYEGMLVQLDRVWITENRTVGQSFFVTGHCCYGGPGTGDTLLVSNLNGVLNAYDSPDSMSVMNIVGILHFTNGTFRLCPRSAADITNYGILDVNGGGSLSLALKVSPNPARIANVTFALPSKGNVDVSVFDLAGRKITTVAKGSFDAGTYTRRWDGTDRAGNRVPAGVYFYSYKVGSQELRTRGVILN